MRFIPQRTDNGTQPQTASALHDYVQATEFANPNDLRTKVEGMSMERGWGLVISQVNGVFNVANSTGPLVKIKPQD